jgi:hypothetical protein
LLTWHKPTHVLPRLLRAWLGLLVWASIAGVILVGAETVAISAENYSGALGIIGGVLLSLVLANILP